MLLVSKAEKRRVRVTCGDGVQTDNPQSTDWNLSSQTSLRKDPHFYNLHKCGFWGIMGAERIFK